MRAYVITILDNEKSVKAAEKCIQSGVSQGLVINKWEATTPADEPFKILKDKGIIGEKLVEVYSRADNCAAAFLSHFSLWEKCMEIQEPIMIFEHDAYMLRPLPNEVLQLFPDILKLDYLNPYDKTYNKEIEEQKDNQ